MVKSTDHHPLYPCNSWGRRKFSLLGAIQIVRFFMVHLLEGTTQNLYLCHPPKNFIKCPPAKPKSSFLFETWVDTCPIQRHIGVGIFSLFTRLSRYHRWRQWPTVFSLIVAVTPVCLRRWWCTTVFAMYNVWVCCRCKWIQRIGKWGVPGKREGSTSY